MATRKTKQNHSTFCLTDQDKANITKIKRYIQGVDTDTAAIRYALQRACIAIDRATATPPE